MHMIITMTGILVHKYGPHIFHTNSLAVFEYLSRFTKWRPYQHRVLARVDGINLPVPINLDTVNRLYGLNLNPVTLQAYYETLAEPTAKIKTSEEWLSARSEASCTKSSFADIRASSGALTLPSWTLPLLRASHVRTDRDDRYFTDTYQSMPLLGYTRMFENMLDHKNINIILNSGLS